MPFKKFCVIKNHTIKLAKKLINRKDVEFLTF